MNTESKKWVQVCTVIKIDTVFGKRLQVQTVEYQKFIIWSSKIKIVLSINFIIEIFTFKWKTCWVLQRKFEKREKQLFKVGILRIKGRTLRIVNDIGV